MIHAFIWRGRRCKGRFAGNDRATAHCPVKMYTPGKARQQQAPDSVLGAIQLSYAT